MTDDDIRAAWHAEEFADPAGVRDYLATLDTSELEVLAPCSLIAAAMFRDRVLEWAKEHVPDLHASYLAAVHEDFDRCVASIKRRNAIAEARERILSR